MDPVMSDSTSSSPHVQAQRVADLQRIGTLPKHFGNQAARFETAVFDWMRTLSPPYTGAYWHFYELSNGGFYMAPDLEKLPLLVEGNGFDDTLTGDAAGITACLFAYSHLSFGRRGERFTEAYHWLLDYACEHAEVALILGAID
jgi:hypothetical protein